MTFEILLAEKTNILAGMDQESWVLTRRIIVELILSTDMAKHFEMLGNFRSRYLTCESDIT
jgi:hypothetical protein